MRATSSYAYSNLWVGLLGEAMAIQEGVPFVDLLAERDALLLSQRRHGGVELRALHLSRPRPGLRDPLQQWNRREPMGQHSAEPI